MPTPIETAAFVPSMAEAGKFAALNAANTAGGVNVATKGLVETALHSSNAGMGNILSMAAPLGVAAGVGLAMYSSIRLLIGSPVWPLDRVMA